MKKFLSIVAAIFLVVAVNFSAVAAQKVIVPKTSVSPSQQVADDDDRTDPEKFAVEVLRLTKQELCMQVMRFLMED